MDKEIQQGLFTCERNLDYFFSSQINFCILVFLLFIYHSFHFLCYYLKFSIFDFTYFLTGLFLTCVFATLAIRHNARARSVRKSCLYMQNIFCSFRSRLFSVYDMIFLDFLFAEIFELAKDSHGGEADCKELVNP